MNNDDILSSILYVLRDRQELIDKDENFAFFNGALKSKELGFTGQNFQDVWVCYELAKKKIEFMTKVSSGGYQANPNLFYVEFGAADGYYMSNTYFFQSQGIKGILAEPNPIYHDDLIAHRGDTYRPPEYNYTQKNDPIFRNHIDFDCISNTTGDWVNFTCTEEPLHSTIEGFESSDYNSHTRVNNTKTHRIKTITLYDLLKKYDAPKDITYISMDTEGSELMILEKFFQENNTYNVWMWTIEHNFTANREKIYDLMTSVGYKRKFENFSRWDDFYIRKAN